MVYIVDQVVRAHGGEVNVKSDALEGTTFAVRLPAQNSRSSRRTSGRGPDA